MQVNKYQQAMLHFRETGKDTIMYGHTNYRRRVYNQYVYGTYASHNRIHLNWTWKPLQLDMMAKVHGRSYDVGDLAWLCNPAISREQAKKLLHPAHG